MIDDFLMVGFQGGDDFLSLPPEQIQDELRRGHQINLAVYDLEDEQIDLETYLDIVEHYGMNMDNYTDIAIGNFADYL